VIEQLQGGKGGEQGQGLGDVGGAEVGVAGGAGHGLAQGLAFGLGAGGAGGLGVVDRAACLQAGDGLQGEGRGLDQGTGQPQLSGGLQQLQREQDGGHRGGEQHKTHQRNHAQARGGEEHGSAGAV
jgi:hypothetical protein